VRLRGPGTDAETLPVAAFTVDGIPSALIAARLAAEDAIEVRHGCLHARPYLTRLLGPGPAGAHASRGRARTGGRSSLPGAIRASAGINTSEGDVARLLRAVERLVSGNRRSGTAVTRQPGTSTQPGPAPEPVST
jgi:selenocysteine lyase/cysteine desulfurase